MLLLILSQPQNPATDANIYMQNPIRHDIENSANS